MNDIIKEFFYEKASLRIKELKMKYQLSNEDIYPENPKLISLIINNTKTKNNRFLLTATAFENLYEKIQERDDQFTDVQTIYWGNESEIQGYSLD